MAAKRIIAATFVAAALAAAAAAAEYKKVGEAKEGAEIKRCLAVMEHPEEKAYCRQKPSGTISLKRIGQWRNNKHYRAAMKVLHDPRYYKSVPVELGDPESRSVVKRGIQKIPDYPRAVGLLDKAARGGNALAAYVGRSLILSYLTTQKREYAEMAAKMAKVLYGDKSCEGYVAWGDTLRDGLAGRRGMAKAPGVYKAGYKACRDVGYYGAVLGSRIDKGRMAALKKKGRGRR